MTEQTQWHFAKTAFSSAKGEWDTPKDLIADLAPHFPWDLDPASSGPNVCANYYTAEGNGLIKPWWGLVWLNPPYGRKGKIGLWMERARKHGHIEGQAVVCLVPARTDTKWWQDNVNRSTQVTFIKGRLKFGSDAHWKNIWESKTINGRKNKLYKKYGCKNAAPFPSAFVVFGTITPDQRQILANFGWTVTYKQSTLF